MSVASKRKTRIKRRTIKANKKIVPARNATYSGRAQSRS